MKLFMLHIGLLIGITVVFPILSVEYFSLKNYTIEQEKTLKEVAENIKKLAHSEEFDQKVAESSIDLLASHKLTIKDCIVYIAEQREERAFKAIMEEWPLSEEKLKKFNEAIARVKEQDKQRAPDIIFMDRTISPELQDLIKEKARDFNITIPIHVHLDQNINSIARVGRLIENTLEAADHVLLIIKAEYAQPNAFQLKYLDAMLQHEFVHVVKQHMTISMAYLFLIDHQDVMSPSKSQSFQKWQRAKEAYADRVGQAYAQNMHTVTNIVMTTADHLMICKKNNIDIYNKHLDPTHPSIIKRFIWADTIDRLINLEVANNSN